MAVVKLSKIFKMFLLVFISILILLIIRNIKNLKYLEINHQEGEKSNLHYASPSELKSISPTNLHTENISKKEKLKGDITNLRPYIEKMISKVKDESSKKMILFHSEYQESCLKNYLLDIQELFADPKRVLELVTEDASQAYMFANFHRITDVLRVKSFIIEPSILHCMLPTKYRDLLNKRNVTLSNGTQHILTFGIFEEDVPVLQKEGNIHEFRDIGIQPYFVQAPLASWMKENSTRFRNRRYTSHIFYLYYTWTFHVVVFYKRNNYLWHAALKLKEQPRFLTGKKLLFVNYDSAYENFSFEPVLSKSRNTSSIYIPSNSHYFLFQIPSSRFLECNSSRRVYIKTPTVTFSSTQFKNKTLTALRELKIFFQNALMNFWIFSGTLLGWYRQCDIIPYTTDVDFGAWASEIDDLNHTMAYFRINKELYLLERMGLLEEALEFQLRCKELRVDVFFMYKIDNGTWASGHRSKSGYYFRYHYPFFTLCSADLLQEKVQVPCEAKDMILMEYGNKWMHPISSWNYESSIHNRGPNIYWGDKRRLDAYKKY